MPESPTSKIFGDYNPALRQPEIKKDVFLDQAELKRQKDLQRQAARRERHLKQMDATKKMHIDQILQSNFQQAASGSSDFFLELLHQDADEDSEMDGLDDEERQQRTREKIAERKEQRARKMREQ